MTFIAVGRMCGRSKVLALRDGKTVILYGNQGAVYVDSTGNNASQEQGGLPSCGVRATPRAQNGRARHNACWATSRSSRSPTFCWEHPDQLITASGSNTLILNAANGWEAGLGVDLPHGTEVTSEEVAIYSVDPRIEWDATPSWSCGNCTAPVTDVPGAVHTVTIVVAQASQPIPDLAIVVTNTYRVMTGSFSVEKIVAGGIDRDDDRLAGAVFTAHWDSTDPAQPTGVLEMRAPDWSAVPVDAARIP